MIHCSDLLPLSSKPELSRDILWHRIWVGVVKFDFCLCLNRTGGLLTLTILCHLSICAFRMNTPSLIALLVDPSAPDNLFVSLLSDLKSRGFLFTYEFLTQTCTFFIVADHY
jgi:hypothetical protein